MNQSETIFTGVTGIDRPGLIRRFAQTQFTWGWSVRKNLEPGGELHPDAKTTYAGLPLPTKAFVTIMSVEILAYLNKYCETTELEEMRDLGGRAISVGIEFPEGKLQDPQNGLLLKDGLRANLRPELLRDLAYMHHEAWRMARAAMSEFPEEFHQKPRAEDVAWDDNTPDEVINPDRINVLCLCVALAKMSNEDFELLLRD